MRTGAIILCGGNSTRMGRDKASLPFGDELMLPRVLRLVSQVVEPSHIVCVAAGGQNLPDLPREVRLTRDRQPNRGPLEGLAVGMLALEDDADAMYVTGCDAPLLRTSFIFHMFRLLEEYDIVVPSDGEFQYPMAAVYRGSVLPDVEKVVAEANFGLKELFARCRTREVPTEQLRSVDPELRSLINCNCPADYQRALTLLC